MKFSVKFSLRLLLWSIIFGFIAGIFGISLTLIQIADFYLQEGTQQTADSYTYRVLPSEQKILTDNSLIELQNIEGIAFVDPYFSPTNEIIGSINYFGFTASYPIQIQGIPKRLGEQKAEQAYRYAWESTDLTIIPVLLPQQAIMLYNNLAPQRSWPVLSEESFLGLPGVKLALNSNELQAVISGFDPDEFGTIVNVPAQKLYAIFKNLELNPFYDYIVLETVPGLTAKQARNSTGLIKDLGYQLASAQEESFQRGIFLRVKYTIAIFGFSIIIAFIFLLYYNTKNLLNTIKQRVLLYRIWAIKDMIYLKISFLSFLFSGLTGFISWIICFFAVIPAQKYIINTISQFGINTPSLRDSVKISLETALISTVLFLSINLFTIFYFYYENFKIKQPKF